jgi:CheY-like chemotaxis protein
MERMKHIVVVDDDADVSDVIVAMLEGEYEVSTADHGAGLRALLDATSGGASMPWCWTARCPASPAPRWPIISRICGFPSS